MQKARRQAFSGKPEHSPSTACRHTVSGTISLPSQGFFSPFPHGTGSLSVASEYLALRDGPRRFPQDFSCPAVLRYPLRVRLVFAYVAITLFGWPFQTASANQRIGNSTCCGPYNPEPCTQSKVFGARCQVLGLGNISFSLTPKTYHLEPALLSVQRSVWAVPISLAATLGITIVFSSSRY